MGDLRAITVGTTAIKIFTANQKRSGWQILLGPTGIHSGNTGRVHIRKAGPPNTTLGDAASGYPITQGASYGEVQNFEDDPAVFKGDVWVTASAASQVIYVKEDSLGENA